MFYYSVKVQLTLKSLQKLKYKKHIGCSCRPCRAGDVYSTQRDRSCHSFAGSLLSATTLGTRRWLGGSRCHLKVLRCVVPGVSLQYWDVPSPPGSVLAGSKGGHPLQEATVWLQ